jgi:hypothetical protein
VTALSQRFKDSKVGTEIRSAMSASSIFVCLKSRNFRLANPRNRAEVTGAPARYEFRSPCTPSIQPHMTLFLPTSISCISAMPSMIGSAASEMAVRFRYKPPSFRELPQEEDVRIGDVGSFKVDDHDPPLILALEDSLQPGGVVIDPPDVATGILDKTLDPQLRSDRADENA